MSCTVDALITDMFARTDADATVQEGVERMAAMDAGSLVLLEGDEVRGLFTERDLITRVVAPGLDPRQVKLRDVATTNLIAITNDTSCAKAIRTMHSNRCRRLLVYEQGRFVGLVKLPDVANALANSGSMRDWAINLFAGITLLVALGVISLLLWQLPEMLRLTGVLSY